MQGFAEPHLIGQNAGGPGPFHKAQPANPIVLIRSEGLDQRIGQHDGLECRFLILLSRELLPAGRRLDRKSLGGGQQCLQIAGFVFGDPQATVGIRFRFLHGLDQQLTLLQGNQNRGPLHFNKLLATFEGLANTGLGQRFAGFGKKVHTQGEPIRGIALRQSHGRQKPGGAGQQRFQLPRGLNGPAQRLQFVTTTGQQVHDFRPPLQCAQRIAGTLGKSGGGESRERFSFRDGVPVAISQRICHIGLPNRVQSVPGPCKNLHIPIHGVQGSRTIVASSLQPQGKARGDGRTVKQLRVHPIVHQHPFFQLWKDVVEKRKDPYPRNPLPPRIQALKFFWGNGFKRPGVASRRHPAPALTQHPKWS